MKMKIFVTVTMALLLCVSTFAQQNHPQKNNGPRLTEDQRSKMKEIRLATFKEIKPLQNQMGELKAKQRSLTTAEKPDMNAINGNIDDMAKLQSKIIKIRTAAQVQVRSLLTDEQKMIFDSKNFRKGPKHFNRFEQYRHFSSGMAQRQKKS